jgi:hypothetical protein
VIASRRDHDEMTEIDQVMHLDLSQDVVPFLSFLNNLTNQRPDATTNAFLI